MQNSISLLFYLKKPKAYTSGMVPIYLRITTHGQRAEISTGREWFAEKWNTSAGRASGTKEDVKALNSYLDTLQGKVYEAHRRLLDTEAIVTAEAVKNKFTGKAEKPRMLMPIFQDHNNKIKALLGEEFSPGTLCRYTTALKHTTEFLKWKFGISDIDIRKIDHAFITEFEFYLRSIRKCNNNSAVKYVKNFGKIIRICISNNWLDKDPFVNYKSKFREVVRAFLSQDEIDAIAAKEFRIERLDQVRDIFIFSCYTGLAYIDVKQLTLNNISLGIDGEKWIFTSRQKTVLSNQKMNSYLKEIADVCGITKELTFHIARHTFATTVTLTNGVSIESVSKMLGHRSIKTTQHYAQILDRKVSDDMKLLRVKLSVHKGELGEKKLVNNN
jgi:site-specific recombinase XerD